MIFVLVNLSTFTLCDGRPQKTDSDINPIPVVIVHGAWGGKHQWKQVTDRLSDSGHLEIHRASLTGLGERSHLASPSINLDTHIEDVVNLIEYENLNSVVLVGHSYAGMIISGVANKIPNKISRLLFLDASLPEDGESFFSQRSGLETKLIMRAKQDGDGWSIPVNWPNPMKDSSHPLATLTQSIQLNMENISNIESEYWLFCDGRPAKDDNLYKFLLRAKARNYQTKSFTWGHNPHRDHITEFSKELHAYLNRVRR